MRILIVALIGFLSISISATAQGKYFTREGFAKFFSESPLENITAENHQVTTVLDTESARMEFAVLMKSFEFEKALMEEHFNENYVESDDFPKASFKGAIVDADTAIDFATAGVYEVVLAGALNIHGVEKEVEVPGTIEVLEGGINANAVFNVACSDHDIKIPSVVKDNIAEIIEVTIEVKLLPFE